MCIRDRHRDIKFTTEWQLRTSALGMMARKGIWEAGREWYHLELLSSSTVHSIKAAVIPPDAPSSAAPAT